MSKSFQK